MHLSRRGFLARVGQSFALAGTGLLAACQSGPPPSTITVTARATSGATTKPAIPPVAPLGPAAAPPAAAPPRSRPSSLSPRSDRRPLRPWPPRRPPRLQLRRLHRR